ncbi:hypothetical protein NDU88_008291 [Pleurodeles waltl]|uniref:Uncharacterized protein n=1 Tax=Pleurodeles waltl TaxID=8319 RepID=A0AAV7NXI6_PLEWA|nr:hypothetical protein NDU88_008291 [Pleurodeles waltl]
MKCSSEGQVFAGFQSGNQSFENNNSVTDLENVEEKMLNDEIKRSKDTVMLKGHKAPVVKAKEVFTTVDNKKEGGRTTANAGCGDLRDKEGRILLCPQKSSNVQLAEYEESQVDRPEERERFGATILTAREKKIAATTSVNYKKVDWKRYDGGVGDGECPSPSGSAVQRR